MSKTVKRNLPASVRQRLLTLSQKRKEPFDTILGRYAIERLLYRLSMSAYADRFLLKGAMLFVIWAESIPRTTRDVDLLGFGSCDLGEVEDIFREICSVVVEPDGLDFPPETVRAEAIRDQAAYRGIRVKMRAGLTNAQIPVQVDIGFGDAVTPDPDEASFPVLLDFPAPRLRAYPIYTVVAEKTEAMASLGTANSRMKDFHDVWFMSQTFDFNGPLLAKAIRNTFERRKTDMHIELPFTEEFSSVKSIQWNAFASTNKLVAPIFNEVLSIIRRFVEPPFLAARNGENFGRQWKAPGDWKKLASKTSEHSIQDRTMQNKPEVAGAAEVFRSMMGEGFVLSSAKPLSSDEVQNLMKKTRPEVAFNQLLEDVELGQGVQITGIFDKVQALVKAFNRREDQAKRFIVLGVSNTEVAIIRTD